MTSNNPIRRATRRTSSNGLDSHGNGRSTVGDKLRDTREVRGLDLYRVERDTKIRHKFLVALEAGEYADLPGDVYARGFLRNYATYLGLDADEIIDEWRSETGPKATTAQPMLGAPRPMVLARRGFFLQTSHMVIAAVVLIVAIVAVYFGYQVTRFLSYPTISVTAPGVAHYTAPIGATNYLLTGTATAGSTVTITRNGQDAKTLTADDGGHWTYQAVLVPGQNEFDVKSQNIDTNHSSQVVKVYIYVPSPTPTAPVPVVAFATPADNTIVTNGNVTITGTSSFVTDVTLTTTYLGVPPAPGATLPPSQGSAAPGTSPSVSGSAGASALPGASATPARASAGASANPSAGASAPPAPAPATTSVTATGEFNFSFQLPAGVWRLSLQGQDTQGHKSVVVSRTVAVPFTGVVVLIEVKGAGGAWMAYYRDGVAIGTNNYPNGYKVTVSAKQNVCIRTGKASNVYVTVNGVSVGTVAKFGGIRLFIDATHPPKNVSAC